MMAEALAVANGDPTMIGYLHGGNLGRGFPRYVREFNANFLALPARPSQRLEGACADPAIVVRVIPAGAQGTYIAVVSTAATPKAAMRIRLPNGGNAKLVVSGKTLEIRDATVVLDFHPFQLRTIHLTPKA